VRIHHAAIAGKALPGRAFGMARQKKNAHTHRMRGNLATGPYESLHAHPLHYLLPTSPNNAESFRPNKGNLQEKPPLQRHIQVTVPGRTGRFHTQVARLTYCPAGNPVVPLLTYSGPKSSPSLHPNMIRIGFLA
jgi:hypothetical protein